jgi:hypothetical protein
MLASVASQNRDFPLDATSLEQSSKQLARLPTISPSRFRR